MPSSQQAHTFFDPSESKSGLSGQARARRRREATAVIRHNQMQARLVVPQLDPSRLCAGMLHEVVHCLLRDPKRWDIDTRRGGAVEFEMALKADARTLLPPAAHPG